jgi:hypothetical protein
MRKNYDMPADVGTGVIGLVGALIGGGSTFGAQMAGARRERGRAAWAEQRRFVAALRLTVLDLDRSGQRLLRKDAGDPRGYTELPRGAWLEYRALLAPHLDGVTLTTVSEAYNQVVEWNEILWAAFSKTPPAFFHGSDQNALDEEAACALLDAMYEPLTERIRCAAEALRSVRDREVARTEQEFMKAFRRFA